MRISGVILFEEPGSGLGFKASTLVCHGQSGTSGDTPLDDELADLGVEFHSAVVDADYPEAKHILKLIEKRSEFLIQE